MARRGFRLGATLVWLALASCKRDGVAAVKHATPDATTVLVEQDAAPNDRWRDFDIGDNEDLTAGCAVEQQGALWCWGEDPTWWAGLRSRTTAPSRVEGVTEARAVAVGPFDICRIDSDRRVHCITRDTRKWQVVEGLDDPQRIVVTELGGCALESDRTLRCWGEHRSAEILARDVVDVAMDRQTGCALRADHEILCWDERVEMTPLGRVADAIDIELDDYRWLLVLDPQGRLMAGEGHGDEVEWSEQRELTDAIELDASPNHLCARTPAGLVRCYGDNHYGQLGGGDSNATDEVITMAFGDGQTVREVAAGHYRTCVRTADDILCVGQDVSAWAPPDTIQQHSLEFEATSLAAHENTTCAIDRAGDLRCWGGYFDQQPELGVGGVAVPTVRAHDRKDLLGIFSTDEALYWIDEGQVGAAPIKAPGRAAGHFTPPKPQSGIQAFASHGFTCAIEAGARASVATCGGIEKRTVVDGIDGPTALATMSDQLCAIDRRAQVVCSPLAAQYRDRKAVASVVAGVQNARSITAMPTAGSTVTMCAALANGRVLCWDGKTDLAPNEREQYVASPVADVGLEDVTSIVGTYGWFCSLDRAGAVACWTVDSGRATPVPGPKIEAEVIRLAAGTSHACALDRTGALTCWGDERYGQLGRVPAAVSLQPTPLSFAP